MNAFIDLVSQAGRVAFVCVAISPFAAVAIYLASFAYHRAKYRGWSIALREICKAKETAE